MKVVVSLFFGLGIFLPLLNAAEPVTVKVGAVQKKCPIMGGDISKKVYTDYEGKRVYFCCPGCIQKFTAEPKKFMDQFQKAGIALEALPIEKGKEPETRKIEGKIIPQVSFHYQSHENPVVPEAAQPVQDADSLPASHETMDNSDQSGGGSCH